MVEVTEPARNTFFRSSLKGGHDVRFAGACAAGQPFAGWQGGASLQWDTREITLGQPLLYTAHVDS